MRIECGKKTYWKKFIKGRVALLAVIVLFTMIFSVQVAAKESRTVRVAFFPM